MATPVLSLDRAWRELEASYDTTFIKQLIAIPTANVYLFGGTVRDMLLDKPWKDADLRVVDRRPKEDRNRDVERVYKQLGTILQQLYFGDGECMVLRARFPGKKPVITDIQVVSSLEATPGDFTISSIFMDLKTGELYSQSPHGFDDLSNRLIRATSEDRVLEFQSTYIFFRALKLACMTGFGFEPHFEQFMRSNTDVVRSHIEEDLAYIREHGKDSFTELRLGNDFGAFKTDPERFVSLINELGFYRPLCQGFATIAPSPKTSFVPGALDPACYKQPLELEQHIAQFLSDIARSISTLPRDCFDTLKKAMALDSDRSDGNEFVVEPSAISYRGA